MTVRFVDTTLRDAHQSLWATRMTTAMMLPIAPDMDEVGFEAIDLMGLVTFDVCVRYLREDPWERIRLVRKAIRRTPLNSWVRSKSLISFDLLPDDVIELWVKTLAANGIRRLGVFDGLHDLDNLTPAIRTARSEGLILVGVLIYSVSPIHTDELYVQKAKELLALGVDAVLLKDPGGLLVPQRVTTLVPALRAVLGRHPLEIHSHCCTGLGPLVYLEAMRLGVDRLHTAISPLAHGPSLPPTEFMVKHAGRMGREATLDTERLHAIAEHFRSVAIAEGKPLGQPAEYDPFHFEHQVPGGMITNLLSQLSQIDLESRLDEILEEVVRVRRELGYPIMVTPISQLVGTQAVLNVVDGERYRTIPNEVLKYALGHYGTLPIPVEPDVMDRIHEVAKARKLGDPEPLPPLVGRLRARLGAGVSDGELLLRIMFPDKDVAALLAAGPIKTEYRTPAGPLMRLIETMLHSRDAAYVEFENDGMRVSLRKRSGATSVSS